MTDVGFVIAGFTGILGGLSVYAATLALRLRRSRREEAALRDAAPPAEQRPPADAE